MSSRATRPRPVKAVPPKQSKVVKPEPLDKVAFKINSLKQTIAQQAEIIADQQATIQELTQFIQANAELLELQVIQGPPPPAEPVDEEQPA